MKRSLAFFIDAYDYTTLKSETQIKSGTFG